MKVRALPLAIGCAVALLLMPVSVGSAWGGMLKALLGGSSATGGARPPLLPNGTLVPDFTALRADNTPLKLSDFRGKVVLVDFWATWCGPCLAAMPHLEKTYQALQRQGLVVLGVCVWDDRAKFDAWMKTPAVPTSYLKVFDPAGRSGAGNIASKLYQVGGIPTFYLIGPDGKVLFSAVGSGPASQHGLDQALRAAGFQL